MSGAGCPSEAELIRAARGGADLPPALTAHVEACPDCRETAAVTRWLMAVARADAVVSAPLPSPDLAWRRSRIERRIARRRTLIRRATRPMAVFHRAAWAGAVLAVAIWLGPRADVLANWIAASRAARLLVDPATSAAFGGLLAAGGSLAAARLLRALR